MLKVVVIDGSAISRNLLTTVLVNGGYQVVGDANPNSAGILSMAKLRPHIVCIDIGVMNEEGLGMLDTLRNALPKALVFLVSGKIDSTAIQSALQCGVQGFIVKPFNAETVLKVIRNAVIKVARQHRAQAADGTTV